MRLGTRQLDSESRQEAGTVGNPPTRPWVHGTNSPGFSGVCNGVSRHSIGSRRSARL